MREHISEEFGKLTESIGAAENAFEKFINDVANRTAVSIMKQVIFKVY